MKTKFKSAINFICILLIIILFLILISFPKTAKTGAETGIRITYQIILPSLFPILSVSLMINKSNFINRINFLKKKEFLKNYLYIIIISNLGGYPIGAKIISEQFKNKEISKNDANHLLYCSINSGPAFSIMVVGGGILNSIKSGILLYICQVLSSFVIFCLIYKKLDKIYFKKQASELILSEIFVESVSDASFSILNISGYIIFCSTFLEIINIMNINNNIKHFFNWFLEISNAILHTKNIYTLSIILSFASFSIIFQILSISKTFKPNILKIIGFKVINSIINCGILFLFLKLFPISFETISNLGGKVPLAYNNKILMTFIFILTFISFILSITNKKICGKFSKDIF